MYIFHLVNKPNIANVTVVWSDQQAHVDKKNPTKYDILLIHSQMHWARSGRFLKNEQLFVNLLRKLYKYFPTNTRDVCRVKLLNVGNVEMSNGLASQIAWNMQIIGTFSMYEQPK
jgi:hypothetical protein